jgi:hypothetical protein
MTQDEIKVKTITPEIEEVIINKAQTIGWMLFIQYPNSSAWSMAYPDHDNNRDTIRFPYPLFKSKDEAMENAKKRLSYGGEAKFFKVDL